ncbi:hypothetical protein BC831DRAFT_437440 [Entophlyctis helioformis]|nr:hypothetical protein BC831DRAFT_437440 [Entophlyctis helioformis]
MSPKEDEAVNWRIEPVGFDAEGNTYFLFDDNRLYLEREQKRAPSRRGKKRRRSSKPHKKAPAGDEESFGDAMPSSNWVLVRDRLAGSLAVTSSFTWTASDWHALAKRFEGSDHPDEQAFYQYLIEDAVPSVSKEFKALEEKKRLEEALMNRKRSSRLQMRQVIRWRKKSG